MKLSMEAEKDISHRIFLPRSVHYPFSLISQTFCTLFCIKKGHNNQIDLSRAFCGLAITIIIEIVEVSQYLIMIRLIEQLGIFII